MTDYKALCAELLAVFDNYDNESNLVGIFDDMKANKIDLLDRARAALAAEPEPPNDEEVADPVIPGEYRGFNAIAYRNGFHAGHKHALTCAALAPQPVPEGPSDAELLELWKGWNIGFDPQNGPVLMPHTAEYARAVLARWGTPNLAQVRSSLGDGSAVPEGPTREDVRQWLTNDIRKT